MLRGLTVGYRRNVAEALRMLLTDSKSKDQPFRDNLIQAMSMALGVAYGGSLDTIGIQERFMMVYPLMAQVVVGVMKKAKPEGWEYIIEELGAGDNPIEALAMPARVVVNLNFPSQRRPSRILGKTFSIYS